MGLKWESSAEFNMQISLKGNEVGRCVNEVQKSTGKKSLEVERSVIKESMEVERSGHFFSVQTNLHDHKMG